MSACSPEKKAIYFNNLSEVIRYADSVKLNIINTPKQCSEYCKSANDIYRKAETTYQTQDEENAYILFMRYFRTVKFLKKSYEFSKSKNTYLLILKECDFIAALDKAEVLKESLSKRYQEKTELMNKKQNETKFEEDPLKSASSSETPQVTSVKRYPSHWSSTVPSFGYEMLPVDSETYGKIEEKFKETMNDVYNIISIEEICNKEYYEKYECKKKAMEEISSEINEMQLWHGTSHTLIEHICHQNFDWRMCERGAYGQGSYFARDASYSNNYVDVNDEQESFMFLADVLVGDYCKGLSSYKRPPEKENFKLYDSCVNKTSDPSIYVIFERDQFYPRYLIKYKRDI